ncbi:truncated ABC transporter ATP-binding component [Lactobacillus acetotolerans]|uniref:Truncated ABC transporter ATP-binding component n=1 Tax=Lactobacillus acetotolerans TaxID=1600 RepID=A0A0D6A3N0_9LACO|nr:hypothetical protein [Lactobacillus acetotolerans]BAQ57130.1 truncated ABC transporter ATP-binding component [Lactobacillus acetotolerans]
MDAIVTKNITKSYGKHQVLKGINLNIKRGKYLLCLVKMGLGSQP